MSVGEQLAAPESDVADQSGGASSSPTGARRATPSAGATWAREATASQRERAQRARQHRVRAAQVRDQQRLPIEVPEPIRRGRRPRAGESREELLSRLLDPELSLSEAATLLGVCEATVRRYTDRGILPHFRTPGNQRRFRLSSLLEFLEHREGGSRR